jgi:multidrug efflux pump
MLENIVRRIKDYGETPLVAAYHGARQVGFAVISTTLVLVAVFVPITFLEGDLGSLFKEFAITISAAVCFSSIVALTLSPMLASKILRETNPRPNLIIRGFDALVELIKKAYLALLGRSLKSPIVMIVIFILTILGSAWVYNQVEEEFTPTEDRGVFIVIVNGPEGASYKYTEEYMTEIERRMMPYVDSGEIKRLLVRAPRSFGNFSNFSGGICIVILEEWDKRRPAAEIMGEIRADLATLPGVRAFPVMRQALGGGNQKPVQFVLGGSTYEELAQWRDLILDRVNRDNPGFIGLDSDYKETRPQLDIKVDYERASELGVTVTEIGRTLETMMGGRNVTTFLDNGEEYEVVLEGEREEQRSINDMENIYVRSARTNQLIPLSNLVYVNEFGAAQTLSRYNRVRAITLEANLEDGFRLGEALTYLEQIVREELPEEAIIDYKGQSRDYITAGGSIIFVFLLGLAVVFLVLSAQFESFVHPFIIMLTVPATVGGGLLGLYLTGNSLNIYSQIGLIMLVGLAAKNGILIVEFANQLRDEGFEFSKAIAQACQVRLRPVLMTGITTIAGSVPLILASGAGAETRIVIGVVVLFGVLVATLLTLFVVPVAYNLLARNTASPNAVTERLEHEIKTSQ